MPSQLTVRRLFLLLALCIAVPRTATAEEPLRILATGVFASSLQSLAPAFERTTGAKIQISIANAGQVAARVTAGEPADLVMSSTAGIKALAKQGVVAPHEVPIGKMRLGVAVPAGAPMLDLTTPEAFRSVLLSAEKVAYIDPNGGGTSGPFFEKMLASMGIADAVHAKAILGKDGAAITKAVASGAAAVGMTQASEIVGAEGVSFGGYIPAELNLTTPYSAAVTTQAKNAKTANAFLEFIASPAGAARLRQAGWDVAK